MFKATSLIMLYGPGTGPGPGPYPDSTTEFSISDYVFSLRFELNFKEETRASSSFWFGFGGLGFWESQYRVTNDELSRVWDLIL